MVSKFLLRVHILNRCQLRLLLLSLTVLMAAVYPHNLNRMHSLSMPRRSLNTRQVYLCRLKPRFSLSNNLFKLSPSNLLPYRRSPKSSPRFKFRLRYNRKLRLSRKLNPRCLRLSNNTSSRCNSSNKKVVLRSSLIPTAHMRMRMCKLGLNTMLTEVLIPLEPFTSFRYPESKKQPSQHLHVPLHKILL